MLEGNVVINLNVIGRGAQAVSYLNSREIDKLITDQGQAHIPPIFRHVKPPPQVRHIVVEVLDVVFEQVRLELRCCPVGDVLEVAVEFAELLGEAEDCLHDIAVEVGADVVEVVLRKLGWEAFWK